MSVRRGTGVLILVGCLGPTLARAAETPAGRWIAADAAIYIEVPRPSLLLAGTMICVGASMLLFVTAHTPLGFVLTSYLAFGVGQGVVNAPITNTAVSGMPRSHAGVAAAVATTSRNIGPASGLQLSDRF